MFMFGLNDVAGSGGAAVAAQTAINDGMVHPNSKTLEIRYELDILIPLMTYLVDTEIFVGRI